MKRLLFAVAVVTLLGALSVSQAAEAKAKKYQVTGPVVEVTESKIVVMKGDEKWEIARTPDTKVEGILAVGAKVTIEYRMVAAAVEVKAGPGDDAKDVPKTGAKAGAKGAAAPAAK